MNAQSKKTLLILKLLRESYIFAIQEVIANKVRTILSLSGITIGIFSIISVFTVFDSLEIYIKDSLSKLGNEMLYVQKWPWIMGDNYPWWKFVNRPYPTQEEAKKIMELSQTAQAVAFMAGTGRTLWYQDNSIKNVAVMAVSYEYSDVRSIDIEKGRYFTPNEAKSGNNVTILGAEISENLFGKGVNPVDKNIKIGGLSAKVIGVLKKEGELLGENMDKQILITTGFGGNFINYRYDGTIMVSPKEGIPQQEMKDEITGILRNVRRLSPKEENNFALNEIGIITQGFEGFFAITNAIGWFIGGFSLLVGGFGIANIMFVSVKERTNIIGIQKALGAKRYFILLQFLFEALFLALIGGIMGLLLIFLITTAIRLAFDFPLILTLYNVLLGVLVSSAIGIVSGIIPAYIASRLDPVEAIRSNQ